MTEKRFCVQERCVVDNTDNETFEFSLKVDAEIICGELNKIVDEYEQLKKEKEELKDGLQEFREYCNYLKSILEENEIWYE